MNRTIAIGPNRVMLNKTFMMLVILGGLLLLARPAWADGPVSAAILDVDDTGFPEIKVVLRVLDPSGRPITGLPVTAFTAQETGSAAAATKVETVLDQQIGVGVILTMDTSGSMYGPSIAAAKTAASAFVRDLQPADQTAIISFSSKVTVQDGLTADRTTALAALDKLAAGGDTALFDAVAESIKVAQSAPLPRKAVLLLTDGGIGIEVSTTTRQQAIALATQAGIPVYTIGLGSEIDRAFLGELSTATGGAFLEAPTAASIPALYAQLSQLLRSQYVVTFKSTASPDIAARSLNLTITTQAGSVTVKQDYKSRRTIAPPTPATEPSPVALAPHPKSNGLLLSIILTIAALAGSVLLVTTIRNAVRNRRLATEFAVQGSLAAEDLRSSIASDEVVRDPEVYLVLDGQEEKVRFRVARQPLTIGSAEESNIRLGAAGTGVAPQHARVWTQDGKLMFHQLAPDFSSRVAGSSFTRGSLKNGDEVEIGTYKLRVEVQ